MGSSPVGGAELRRRASFSGGKQGGQAPGRRGADAWLALPAAPDVLRTKNTELIRLGSARFPHEGLQRAVYPVEEELPRARTSRTLQRHMVFATRRLSNHVAGSSTNVPVRFTCNARPPSPKAHGFRFSPSQNVGNLAVKCVRALGPSYVARVSREGSIVSLSYMRASKPGRVGPSFCPHPQKYLFRERDCALILSTTDVARCSFELDAVSGPPPQKFSTQPLYGKRSTRKINPRAKSRGAARRADQQSAP